MLYVNALNMVETVAPTVEPLTTAEANTHLHLDGTSNNTYVDLLIEAARQHVESYTGRALAERTYRADLFYWDTEVRLIKPPLISVTSIKYFDPDNSQQTWASTNYEVDAAGGRILLANAKSIPSSYSRFDAWQVTTIHGYQATSSPLDYRAPIPESLKSAMKLIIGDLFENRERSTQLRMQDLPTVTRLLEPYRTR